MAETGEQTSVAIKWQSGARLGRQHSGERSIFAERWERMISQLLYQSEYPGRRTGPAASTVSFRTDDYRHAPTTTKVR